MAAHYKIKTKRKPSTFSIIILILTIFITIGIVITLNYFWHYLEAYESHNPENIINEYIDALAQKNYSQAVKASGFKYDYFNDEKAFEKFMGNKFGDDFSEIKILKTRNDGENLNYKIYSGDSQISSLMLIPAEKHDKYGFKDWKIKGEEIEKLYTVKICAPKEAKVLIDEKEVNSDYLSEEKYEIKTYSSLDNKELSPKFSVYNVSQLLNKPSITAFSDDEDYNITVNENNKTAMVLPKINDEWSAEIKKPVEDAAIKYAEFTTQDATFEELTPYLVKDSDFYRRIKDFKNEWQPEHTFSYDNVNIKDVVKYDSDHFTANISFKYILNRGNFKNSYDVSYNTCFIKIDGKWLLVTIF